MKKFILGFLISSIIFGSTTVLAASGELKAVVSDFKIKLFGSPIKTQSKVVKVNGEYYIALRDVSELIGNENKYVVNTKTKTIDFIKAPKNVNKTTVGSQNNFKIHIPDKALENIVRHKIGNPKGDIHFNDIKQVDAIYHDGKGIKSLEGLQHFKSLKDLQLPNSEIKDINALSKLSQLEFLDLYNGEITDISPLAALKNLKTLSLSYNKITDITALSGLSNLETLSLTDNNITDISPLKNLKNIKNLALSNNPIFDISSLREMKLGNTSDLLFDGETNYYKLPYNNFAIRTNGKLYTTDQFPIYRSFYIDVNNKLYVDYSGLTFINFLLNVKTNGYTVADSKNPFFDGVMNPNKWDNYSEIEIKYANATERYTTGKIFNTDKSIIFEYQVKKGNYKGVIAFDEYTIVAPLSEILNNVNIALKTELDTANKLVIFTLD